MLGPSGKTVSVGQRDLADTHGVCGSVALIQIGIFGEGFLLSRHPIGWLIEIQFLAVGDYLDPRMHLGVNLFAILTGSLVHAVDFVPVAPPLFRVIAKILGGCFVHVTIMV
jgi:hypothetical protein